MTSLEEIKRVEEYQLPFQKIDESSTSLLILDCLLSNYEIPLTIEDISDIINLEPNKVEIILEKFKVETIINIKKDSGDTVFLANFTSPKTMGLFQYYRAVLDENLERLAYNKIDLK